MWGFYFIKIFIKMDIKTFKEKLNEYFKLGEYKVIDENIKFFKKKDEGKKTNK